MATTTSIGSRVAEYRRRRKFRPQHTHNYDVFELSFDQNGLPQSSFNHEAILQICSLSAEITAKHLQFNSVRPQDFETMMEQKANRLRPCTTPVP